LRRDLAEIFEERLTLENVGDGLIVERRPGHGP
jgi:hypothetical protein